VFGAKNMAVPDAGTKFVLRFGFANYMTNAPFKKGVWSVIKKVGKDLNLRLEIDELKKKYQDMPHSII
jgi:hypothetical protein